MPLIITTPIQFFGRKVITDLALRNGFADANSYSPFQGCNGDVYANSRGDSQATLEYLFERQSDFDADKKQPHVSHSEDYNQVEEEEEYDIVPAYDPAKHKTDFNDYLRRLEDIADDYVNQYVRNVCFTIFQRSGSDGAITYNAQHRMQPTLTSLDDETEVTEFADIQLQGGNDDYSPSMKQTAIDNLPYVMKRLHNLSKYCGIHMLSMIASYITAKEKNDTAVKHGVSTKTLKRNPVIAEGVWKCDKYGNIGEQITIQSKNVKADHMFNWLNGTSSDYPAYREDYLNFVQYCRILNIEMKTEDMLQFNNDYIESLVVKTLTPNNQYNPAVFDAIRDSKLLSKREDKEDVYVATMGLFRDLCTTNEDLVRVIRQFSSIQSEANMKLARELYTIYYTLVVPVEYRRLPDANKFAWQDGFLYYDNELVILDLQLITNERYKENTFIISELGYCVHTTDDVRLEMTTINFANDYAKGRWMPRTAGDVRDYEQVKWVWYE